MKVTLKQLQELNACKGGIEWYKQVGNDDLVELVEVAIKEETFTTTGGEKEDTLKFANWGIVRLMLHKQKTQYAIYAARQVLKFFEDKYPEDLRPRKAVEAAEKWVESSTEENKTAAAAAADAASAATYAAINAAKVRLMAKILRYGVKLLVNGDGI